MARRALSRRGAAIELALVEVAFVAVLARLWVAQRALWANGFDPLDPFAMPHARTDFPAGTADAWLVAGLGALLTALWLWLAVRAARWDTPALRVVALGVPALAALALFVAPPSLSIDAYSLALTPGRNPYLDPSASLRDTPYGALLGAAGWLPVHPQSPYGPLWTLLERTAVALSGDDLTLGVHLVKLPALAGLGAAAWLTWDLVGRIRPAQRMRAVLLLVASPLSLIELAGDGHNDGLMIALVLLALVACVRRLPALAVVALALAVLVKATPLPLALPIATSLVVTRRSWRRLAVEGGIGVLVSAALAVLLVAPYWAGAATFQGLAASGAVAPSWSIPGALLQLLGGTYPDGSPVPDSSAGDRTRLVLGAVLVVGAAAASVTSRTTAGLLRSCAAVSLLALVLLPVEWPWYAALPAALLPLVPDLVAVAAVALLTLGSRLVAPYGDAATIGVVGYDTFAHEQALLGQTVPGLAALARTGVRAAAGRLRRPAADGAAAPPAP